MIDRTRPLTWFQLGLAKSCHLMAYKLAMKHRLRFLQIHIPIEDVEQSALLFLYEAARRFEPLRAFNGVPIRFTTYAYHCVTLQLRTMLRDRLIKTPHGQNPMCVQRFPETNEEWEPSHQTRKYQEAVELDIKAAMRVLSPRQKEVIRYRLGGLSCLDVANKLGVTKQRAVQLEQSARKRMRTYLEGKGYS